MTSPREPEAKMTLPPGSYVVEVDCETTGQGQLKVGQADYLTTVGHPSGSFKVYADEPAVLGGEGKAPLPVEYLLLAVGF